MRLFKNWRTAFMVVAAGALIGVPVGTLAATKAGDHSSPGCIWVWIKARDANGHFFTRVPQFNFKLDGKVTVGNSGFGNSIAHEHWTVSQGKHTLEAVVPQGWSLEQIPKSPIFVRGSKLHRCATTLAIFRLKAVPVHHHKPPVKHHRKVIHKTVVHTRVINRTIVNRNVENQQLASGKGVPLPDTGPAGLATGGFASLGLGTAIRGYLRSRKGLTSALLGK